jgi:hypothetical protein
MVRLCRAARRDGRHSAPTPELARPLLAAPRPQQRAILYFAAVQYRLCPGIGRAADLTAGLPSGRPLALVELGTSAGLLLLPDRYGYRHASGDRSQRCGRIAPRRQ